VFQIISLTRFILYKAYTDGDSFQREMDALLRVRENSSHPNICTLQENFEKRGNYYLVLVSTFRAVFSVIISITQIAKLILS
jgi:hypothetical protein